VVVRTYSKVWSLAALRLGFAVGPAPVVAELEKAVLPYHLSAATQLAGVTALSFDEQMRGRVDALVRERHRLVAELMRIPYLTVFPSGANFVLVRFAGDGHALWQRLVEEGVLVRDFSRWPRLESCVRITVGTPDEDDRLLDALRDAIDEEQRRA
jgi:histidinol-phosphate aminotransferase